MNSILIALASLLMPYACSNLICNGDFENSGSVQVTEDSSKFWSGRVQENGCWFPERKSGSNWEIDEYREFGTTQCLVLSLTICQNVSMILGETYVLKFNAFYGFSSANVQFQVIIDNRIAFKFNARVSNKSFELSHSFSSRRAQDKLCFRSLDGNYPYLHAVVRGIIDNISLTLASQLQAQADESESETDEIESKDNETQIQTQIIAVHFIIECDEKEDLLILKSNLTYSEELIGHFRSSLTVSIEEEIQNSVQYEGLTDQNITAFLTIDKRYELSTLKISIPNYSSGDKETAFQVAIQSVTVAYFQPLSQWEKEIIKNVQPVTQKMSETVKSSQSVMSTFVCTYFILALLNFWNVSLMYNFVMVRMVPGFVRDIFADISEFFYTNGDIFTWLPQSLQPTQDFFLFAMENSLSERMQDNREGFKWFLSYSFSSKIMRNNLENFIGFGLLLVRVLFFKLILKLLSLIIGKDLEKECSFEIVIIKEALGMAPFFLISAFTMVLSHSESFQQRLEKIGQIVIILAMEICYIALLLPSAKKSNSRKQNSHQLNENYCEFNELLLGFSTPILVIIGSPLLLLIVNGLILVFTLADFIRRFLTIGRCSRFFGTLRMAIWLIFHSSFFVFYCLEEQIHKQGQFTDFQSKIAIKSGFAALFCLLIGGALELLRCLAEVVLLFYQYLSLICRNRNSDRQLKKKKPQTANENVAEEIIVPAKKVGKKRNKKGPTDEKAIKVHKRKDKQTSSPAQFDAQQSKFKKSVFNKTAHRTLVKFKKSKNIAWLCDESKAIEQIEVDARFDKPIKRIMGQKAEKVPQKGIKKPKVVFKKPDGSQTIEGSSVSSAFNKPIKGRKSKKAYKSSNRIPEFRHHHSTLCHDKRQQEIQLRVKSTNTEIRN